MNVIKIDENIYEIPPKTLMARVEFSYLVVILQRKKYLNIL